MPQKCKVFFLHCTSQINMVGHFYGVKIFTPQNGRPCFFATYKENSAILGHVCVDIIFYFEIIFLTICISKQLVSNAFQRPTWPIQGNVFL